MAGKKSKTNWPATIGITLILTAIVFFVCLFLQSETKTTGNWPEPEISESLTCEVEGRLYPFFNYDNSEKKITKINAIFKNDNINTVSLVHKLYYDNDEQIIKSEAENHAAMNLKTQAEGLGPDALGANYSRLSDSLKMSLYVRNDDINSNTVKYFELDWVDDGAYNLMTTKAIYEKKGFVCVVNDK